MTHDVKHENGDVIINGISFIDLIEAFTDIMDGIMDHDIHNMTGLPEDACVKIALLRRKSMAELKRTFA
jgi:hypothetical protein